MTRAALLDRSLAASLLDVVHPLTGAGTDYDPLLAMVGDARVVLLGEATHGTHEFYRERARITRRLVEEKGFSVVAVEADWPDAYRVNRWVRGVGDERDARSALDGFRRFPTWMWRNEDVLDFIIWLRERNSGLPRERSAGFYGLDLYSLHSSIGEVIRYLDEVDPEAARRARYRYGCFEQFGEDSQAYGYAAEFGLTPPCEDHAVQQLVELQRRGTDVPHGGGLPEDEHFHAEQNARLVLNAEEYYRTMFRGRVSSWNLRDRHMAETLEALLAHFDRGGARTKAVVWAHNSHIGDARATAMGDSGEWNVGQLARERWGRDAVLVGFSTYTGTVLAANDWGDPPELKRVRPALSGSIESLLHDVGTSGTSAFVLPLRDRDGIGEALDDARLERAIGVIYRPESERVSHYFEARVADQFDALVHFDVTAAVRPLDQGGVRPAVDLPETAPTGL